MKAVAKSAGVSSRYTDSSLRGVIQETVSFHWMDGWMDGWMDSAYNLHIVIRIFRMSRNLIEFLWVGVWVDGWMDALTNTFSL